MSEAEDLKAKAVRMKEYVTNTTRKFKTKVSIQVFRTSKWWK